MVSLVGYVEKEEEEECAHTWSPLLRRRRLPAPLSLLTHSLAYDSAAAAAAATRPSRTGCKYSAGTDPPKWLVVNMKI